MRTHGIGNFRLLAVVCLLGLLLLGPLLLGMRPAAAAEIPAVAPREVGLSAERLADVKPAMQQFVDSRQYAGAVTVVARHGKIALFETVGMADIASKRPMTRDTIFRIYSMSKPVTSVAAMMLVEQGQLDLDAAIEHYLPEFKGIGVFADQTDGKFVTEPVERVPTVRDLMRHTAGLTYGVFGNTPVDQAYLAEDLLADYDRSLQDTVKRLSSIPLLYQPGSQFHYSIATDVLGRVVEVASGKSLDEFFRTRIFLPLQMHDTGFHVPEENWSRLATNYITQIGGIGVQDAAATSRYRQAPALHSGGGGLVSTARDYLRFCQMVMNGGELDGVRLLKLETVREMTSNQLDERTYPLSIGGQRRPGAGFGLGFSVIVEKVPFADFIPKGEFGWGGAASTHFWISPRHDVCVIVLSQQMPFTFRLEAAIKPIVYDAVMDAPSPASE